MWHTASEDVTIVVEVNHHPWVGNYFEVLVYTSVASIAYGWTWTKGLPFIVEERSCSGHCNGTFIGVDADHAFTRKPITSENNFWISSVPGDFVVPYPVSWGLYGERMNEYTSPVYGIPEGQCYYECDDNEQVSRPGVRVGWYLKEGVDSIPQELLP